MLDKVEVLMAARDIIKDDRNWARGWFAQNHNGMDCDVTSANATSFCVLGSVRKSMLSMSDDDSIYGTSLSQEYFNLRNILEQNIPGDFDDYDDTDCKVARFNDNKDTQHSDIIHLLTKSIQHVISGEDVVLKE